MVFLAYRFLPTHPVKFKYILKQSHNKLNIDQWFFQHTGPVKGKVIWTTALRDTRVKIQVQIQIQIRG